jgi:gamma-glutamylcyclotransferase (GGCT)/AIG2-like uncharacterized protein YtfP
MSILNEYDEHDEFDDFGTTPLYGYELHRIFVYGTLMSGMRNHQRLRQAKLVCSDAHTRYEDDYWMTTHKTNGGYLAPVVTHGIKNETKGCIQGEVYDVNDDTLMLLDTMEGHPDTYRRTEIAITYGEINQRMWMYMYMGEPTNSIEGITNIGISNGSIILKWSLDR